MLSPQRRKLYKYKGAWFARPEPAAFGIRVSSWEDGMRLVFSSWEVFLDWYSSNLLY